MAIMEVNIVPLGTSTPSVSKYIAAAMKVLREWGGEYELTSMGTIVEGELDDLLELARRMHLATFAQGVKRVVTTLKIDERRDKPSSMRRKVQRVRQKL